MHEAEEGLVADQVLLSAIIYKDVACVAVLTYIRRDESDLLTRLRTRKPNRRKIARGKSFLCSSVSNLTFN